MTALASFAGGHPARVRAGLAGLLEYWTATVHDTDRIGTATWNTNQNAAGALARLWNWTGPPNSWSGR